MLSVSTPIPPDTLCFNTLRTYNPRVIIATIAPDDKSRTILNKTLVNIPPFQIETSDCTKDWVCLDVAKSQYGLPVRFHGAKSFLEIIGSSQPGYLVCNNVTSIRDVIAACSPCVRWSWHCTDIQIVTEEEDGTVRIMEAIQCRFPKTLPTKNPNISLRCLTDDDVSAFHTLINDVEVIRGLFAFTYPTTIPDIRNRIERYNKNADALTQICYAVILRESDQHTMVGTCKLHFQLDARSTAELGYWYGRQYWGKGYGTEVAASLVQFAFEEVGVRRVCGNSYSYNVGSSRVMQKVGLSREGVQRQFVERFGEILDLEMYSMVRQEYAIVKQIKEEAVEE